VRTEQVRVQHVDHVRRRHGKRATTDHNCDRLDCTDRRQPRASQPQMDGALVGGLVSGRAFAGLACAFSDGEAGLAFAETSLPNATDAAHCWAIGQRDHEE
jgi:hypothetical protein